MSDLSHLQSELERAQFLQDTLIAFATNDNIGGDQQDYEELRRHFLASPKTKSLVPDWLRARRNANEFWHFVKYEFDTYSERREFIWNQMAPLLEYCESLTQAPADSHIETELARFNVDEITHIWQKALERKIRDPEGAITIARTMLESVCKHILNKRKIEYTSNKIELPELYKLTAKNLNLATDQHTEPIYKQILGGCSSIINGLGALRNKLGDAHGHGEIRARPAARHAALAINLAGTMALYLLETYHQQGKK